MDKNRKFEIMVISFFIWRKILKFLLWTFSIFILLSVSLTIVYRFVNPLFTPLMHIRYAEFKTEIKYDWIELKDIPQSMIYCTVISEDMNFQIHNGFDFKAIKKSINERKENGYLRGASTISQQTARNVFLWQDRTWFRKALEAYFTVLIEIFWGKERILEVYLNVIETGNGIYGIKAAAKHYFNKPVEQLTIDESALIVSCLPIPLKCNPAKPSESVKEHANVLIKYYNEEQLDIRFDKESVKKARKKADRLGVNSRFYF